MVISLYLWVVCQLNIFQVWSFLHILFLFYWYDCLQSAVPAPLSSVATTAMLTAAGFKFCSVVLFLVHFS